MIQVAALYIDPKGPYVSMPDVDPWDESRDARLYPGPWPIVAHPPCGPWSKLKAFCKYQEKSLAPIAVDQVRRWGGILEHPVGSGLWPECRLPRPGWLPDSFGGFTIQVKQCRWGHRAEKATLLYMVGIDARLIQIPPWIEPVMLASSPPKSQCPSRKRVSFMGKTERRLTPPAFARWLVDLAATGEGETK